MLTYIVTRKLLYNNKEYLGGEELPEAHDWPTRDVLLRRGYLKMAAKEAQPVKKKVGRKKEQQPVNKKVSTNKEAQETTDE